MANEATRPGLGLCIALLLAVSVGAGRAFAGFDMERQTLEVIVGSASRGDKSCQDIATLVGAQFRARNRFAVVATDTASIALPQHRLVVDCDATNLMFHWLLRTRDDFTQVTETAVRIAGESKRNPAALAFQSTFEVLQALPWDGELSRAAPGRNGTLHGHASVGAINSELVVPCLPVTIGRLKGAKTAGESFEKLGEGAVQLVDDFHATVDYARTRRPGKTGGKETLVLRFTPTAAQSAKQRTMVSDCKQGSAAASRGLLTAPKRSFSTDDLAVTANKQNFGGSYIRLNSTNGVRNTLVAAATFSDRVGFGDHLVAVVNGIKDVYSRPYAQNFTTTTLPPLVTVVQAYFLLRVPQDGFAVCAGFGAIGSKVNVPYLARGTVLLPSGLAESAVARRTSVMPGVFAGYETSWSDLLLNAEAAIGRSGENPYESLHLETDYRLFNVWFAGFDLRSDNFGPKASGEPGVLMTSMGVHVGFALTN